MCQAADKKGVVTRDKEHTYILIPSIGESVLGGGLGGETVESACASRCGGVGWTEGRGPMHPTVPASRSVWSPPSSMADLHTKRMDLEVGNAGCAILFR